jgi:predicted molibdopterin-dependent oxidoreductase YjgC
MKMRIAEHPILGVYEKGQEVEFVFNGEMMKGFAGEPIAAALRASGVRIHRFTKKAHRPRGIFCAIGRCTDCVMIVNGVANVRACVTPLQASMDIRTQHGYGSAPEGGF